MPRHFISCEKPQTPMPQAIELFCKDERGVSLHLGGECSGRIKRLKFARDTQPGVLVEQFEHFVIITCFDASAKIQALEISEYEALKATLAFGLRAGEAGVSARAAFRMFMFYLLSEQRGKDAAKFLKICAQPLGLSDLAQRAKAEIDLFAIAMDAAGEYFDGGFGDGAGAGGGAGGAGDGGAGTAGGFGGGEGLSGRPDFSGANGGVSAAKTFSDLAEILLINGKKPSLALEFARFFKPHKKASDAAGALKIIKKAKNAK